MIVCHERNKSKLTEGKNAIALREKFEYENEINLEAENVESGLTEEAFKIFYLYFLLQ